MAGWDSYTQKATPEDNDTLMIKDTAAGANKRTPFSGVWNWMLNKLANAVISQLETSNKSIIPAINELNSKNVFAGTAIQSGDDLNDYTTPGIYYSPASAVSGTLINIPDESAKTSGFSLLVLPISVSGSGGRVSQTIIRGSEASTIYTRSESSSGWRSWYKYAGEQLPD